MFIVSTGPIRYILFFRVLSSTSDVLNETRLTCRQWHTWTRVSFNTSEVLESTRKKRIYRIGPVLTMNILQSAWRA
jgi:hypothetical protein